jgi:ABC-type lipoprotein export system ATPase subunit
MVTHDANVAHAAGRVVRMRDGRIAEPQPGDDGVGPASAASAAIGPASPAAAGAS